MWFRPWSRSDHCEGEALAFLGGGGGSGACSRGKIWKSRLSNKHFLMFWSMILHNRPFAQLWPGNEVRGIAGQNRLRCVCFSFELSFFFYFGMSFSDECCVPRCSNRGMASPSLLSLSFQRSSELRERFFTCHSSGWLIELARPQQHGRMHGKHILPEKNVRFHARA